MTEIRLRNHLDELSRMRGEIETFAESRNVGVERRKALHLVLEELVTNVIRHGCDDERPHEIVVRLDREGSAAISIAVEDDGRAFDPTRIPVPYAGSSKGEGEVGGRGIGLVRRLVNQLRYERRAERNVLTMRMPGGSND